MRVHYGRALIEDERRACERKKMRNAARRVLLFLRLDGRRQLPLPKTKSPRKTTRHSSVTQQQKHREPIANTRYARLTDDYHRTVHKIRDESGNNNSNGVIARRVTD